MAEPKNQFGVPVTGLSDYGTAALNLNYSSSGHSNPNLKRPHTTTSLLNNMPTLNTTTTSNNNNNMYSSSNNNSSSNSNSNVYMTQVQSPTTGYAVKRVLTSSSHPSDDMPMAVEVFVCSSVTCI